MERETRLERERKGRGRVDRNLELQMREEHAMADGRFEMIGRDKSERLGGKSAEGREGRPSVRYSFRLSRPIESSWPLGLLC